MFKTTLVGIDIEAGKQLIDILDRSGLPVQTALWYYDQDADDWRLLIASPLVDQKGPQKAYEFIQSALKEMPPDTSITLHNIQALSPKREIIKLVRKRFRIGPGEPGYRLQRGAIDAVYIDDAYIYRSQ